jgi:hypothetical protein
MPKKKRKPYPATDKRKARDDAQTNWKYRLDVYTRKLKGEDSQDIAKDYKVTRQAIDQIWDKVKDIPVSEMQSKITIHL